MAVPILLSIAFPAVVFKTLALEGRGRRRAGGRLAPLQGGRCAGRRGQDTVTGFLLAGPAMLSLRETSAEIGGAIDLLARVGGDSAELVPLLGARANSAAPLSNACWDELRGGVLDRLGAALEAGPIDGVLLAMHGNMCVGNVPGQPVDLDPEGTLAADVRALVGAATHIVMTVDLHANVTPLMVEHLDGCISYDHYPHDDIFRTVSPDAHFR